MKVNRQVLSPDNILDKRYRVIRALGQGGMAYVYLAEDLETGRLVALKVMRDELSDDPEFIRRFATEARAAASLDHPNIVHVLDYGQDGEIRYIVQEYVQGRTLKDMIREHGALNYQLAIPLMIQIGLALEHAHARGVIHRDIKPQNILITDDMVAKVTDFGIARTTNTNTITLTGGVAFGSVHYFSPEQARGGVVTERSDLYSLGIMMYEMLTGVLPFDGESSVAVAIKQLQEMPARPSSIHPGLSRALDDIIFKAIQKKPEQRYQSAREFVQELDAFMQNPNGRYGIIEPGGRDWNSGTTALGVQPQSSNYRKVREIQETINKRKKSRYRDTAVVIGIVSVTIVLLIVLFTWIYHHLTSENTPSDDGSFVLEDYSGRNINEVKELLETKYKLEENVDYFIDYEPNDVIAGNIFDQTPKGNVRYRKGRDQLRLKVSSGREDSKVPDVVGKSRDEAEQILLAAQYKVRVIEENSNTVSLNHVIRTTPAADAVLPKNKEVVLYVSKGMSRVKVPDIEGNDWFTAKRRLEDAGLGIYAQRGVSGELPEGERYVIKQYPTAGAEVDPGSTVSVEYGNATDLNRAQNPTEPPKTKITLPDFKGKTWKQVSDIMSHWSWPAGKTVYVAGAFGNIPDYRNDPDNVIVVSQSIEAGSEFNTETDKLTFNLATREEYENSLKTTTTTTTTTATTTDLEPEPTTTTEPEQEPEPTTTTDGD